MQAHYEL